MHLSHQTPPINHLCSNKHNLKNLQKVTHPFNQKSQKISNLKAEIFYLSNLSESTKENQIRFHFKKFGKVSELKLARLADGRCKGHGKLSLVFPEESSALGQKKMMKNFLNFDHKIEDRKVRIERFIQEKNALSFKDIDIVKRRICILNIPEKDISDEKLRSIFEYFFGDIYGAYVRKSKKKKLIKKALKEGEVDCFAHHGFVTFKEESSVELALETERLILKKSDWKDEGFFGQGVCYPYKYEENTAEDAMMLGEREEYMVLEIKPFRSKHKKEKKKKEELIKGFKAPEKKMNQLLGNISVPLITTMNSKNLSKNYAKNGKIQKNVMQSMAKNEMFGMQMTSNSIRFANENITENVKHLLANISDKNIEGKTEHPLFGYGSEQAPFQGVGSFGFMESLCNQPVEKKKKKKRKRKKKKKKIKEENKLEKVENVDQSALALPMQRPILSNMLLCTTEVRPKKDLYRPNLLFGPAQDDIQATYQFLFYQSYLEIQKNHQLSNLRLNKKKLFSIENNFSSQNPLQNNRSFEFENPQKRNSVVFRKRERDSRSYSHNYSDPLQMSEGYYEKEKNFFLKNKNFSKNFSGSYDDVQFSRSENDFSRFEKNDFSRNNCFDESRNWSCKGNQF